MEQLPTRSEQRSSEALSGSTGRTYAIIIICLSLATGFTGNALLCMVGLLTGMMLCNGARGAGPLVPLAALTAVLAMVQLIIVFSMFISVLASTPTSFCSRSAILVEYATGVPVRESGTPMPTRYASVAATSGHAFEGQEGMAMPSPSPPLGYPWNETRSARGATATSASAERLISFANGVHKIACGPNASLFILGIALLFLSYATLILFPLIILAIRVGRLARGAGGCMEYSMQPMYAVVVQGQRAADGRNAAVGVPVRVATGTVPQAQAHPGLAQGNVASATPVRGVVTGNSMH